MKKKNFFLLLIAFFLCPRSAYAGEVERILSLVDYIAGDYGNAVSGGEVVSELEYAEMTDFSASAAELWKKLPERRDDAVFSPKFESLRSMVEARAPVSEVRALAEDLKAGIISAYGLKPYPRRFPDYEAGKSLYAANCAGCHGVSGRGDGPAAAGLDPPPRDFADPDVNLGLSPFKVYNTTVFGIQGTAMGSFDEALDEGQKWDVAFYVLSLGYPDPPGDGDGPGLSAQNIPYDAKKLENLALASNAELLSAAGSDGPGRDVLFSLRTAHIQDGVSAAAFEAVAHTLAGLKRAVELYEAGEKDEALAAAIDGYLGGFQKIEPALMSKKSSLVFEVEKKMGLFRSWIASDRPPSDLRGLRADIEQDLYESQSVLESGSSLGSWLSFVSSFSIILREALEALLILAAFIAALAHSGNRSMIRYVHYGWVLAVLAGLATWALARSVIDLSGARREIVEGVTSLLAAAVLFYVSYWLISKSDMKKWRKYVRSKIQGALTRRSGLTLAFVSFLAVYREAFETLLFYQALFFQADASVPHVIYGLLAGLAVVAAMVFLVYRFALRIPLKHFFSFTSVFLYLLCFVLLGKGVLELQEAGVISSTPADFVPYVNILGMYPTYETAAPQAVLVLLALALLAWRLGNREKAS